MQIVNIGKAWILLGALRLHLVLPPPGIDPAGKVAFKHQHTVSWVQEQLEPELEARSRFQNFPGGLDESTNMRTLQMEIDSRLKIASALEMRCVARPMPSRYQEVQQEVTIFARGLGRSLEMCPHPNW